MNWILSQCGFPGTATNSPPCHPPAAIRDCHGVLQELWQQHPPGAPTQCHQEDPATPWQGQRVAEGLMGSILQVLGTGATGLSGLTCRRDHQQQAPSASCRIAPSKAAAVSPAAGTTEWLMENLLICCSFQSKKLNKLTPISAYCLCCAKICSSSGAASWAVLLSPSQGQVNDGVYPSFSHLLPPLHQSPRKAYATSGCFQVLTSAFGALIFSFPLCGKMYWVVHYHWKGG